MGGETVREEIVKKIRKGIFVESTNNGIKLYYVEEVADQILAIPGVAVLADDQTPSENPYHSEQGSVLSQFYAYDLAQRQLIEAGWRKIKL